MVSPSISPVDGPLCQLVETNRAAQVLRRCARLSIHSGQICNTAWNWTLGKDIYVSTTVGTLTQTAPAASQNHVQIVGYALSADTIYFNPEYGTVEIA